MAERQKYLHVEPLGGGRYLVKITEGHPKLDQRFSIIRVEMIRGPTSEAAASAAAAFFKSVTGSEWKPE